MNYPDPYCRWNRLSPQKLGVKHNTMKKENEQENEFQAQPALGYWKNH
jgi:hypothetical protein